MNKQELIGILEGLEGDSFIEKYNEGYDQAVRDCLIAVKQLDEPKKTVLPKKADGFIKEGEGIGSDKVDIIDSAISFARAIPNDEFSLWFKSNRDLFVDAVSNSYEVKKEPRYVISVPNNSFFKHYLARFINNNFEKPVFRHIGEEDPLFFKDKAKATVIADWVKGTVEKWEEE